MRAVIIGAGVGGLAVARGLLANGIQVEVYERGEELRTGGGGLGIYSNGTAALAALGVDVTRIGRRLTGLESRDPAGRVRLTVDLAAVSDRFGRECRTVPRRSLLELLAEGLPEGTVRFGRECVDVRAGERPSAVFADGSGAEGDVVVGADGVRSVPRRVLWGSDPARPSGWVSWQALTPVPIALARGTTAFTAVGREGMCGVMPAGDGLVQWWFDVRRAPGDPAPPSPSPAAMLRERFDGWRDPDVRTILEHADDADLAMFPHVKHRVPKVWGVRGATLLGDAAHAFPPSTAQGANQALEDAWALTEALGAPGAAADPGAALRGYERARRPPAATASFVSGLEVVMRMRPPGLLGRRRLSRMATRQYSAYLRRVSSVLADGARAGSRRDGRGRAAPG